MVQSALVCTRCRFQSLLSSLRPINQPSPWRWHRQWQWQLHREMSSGDLKRRRSPSRMLLADDVNKSGAVTTPRGGRSKRRAGLGPLASINVTHIPARLRQQLETEVKSRTSSASERAKPDRKKKDDRPLFHALKMQRALTPLSYGQRDKIKAKLEGITHFEQLGLLPSVASAIYTQALPGLVEYTPTPIQKLAIPALLSSSQPQRKQAKAKPKPQETDPETKTETDLEPTPESESAPVSSSSSSLSSSSASGSAMEPNYAQFLLAAETGSGKTLAYLLPVIDAVKRQDEIDKAEDAATREREAAELARKQAEDVFHADPSEDELDGRMNSSSRHHKQNNGHAGKPRALILLPSSELVTQVGKVVKAISHTVKFRSAPISAANSATVIRNRVFNPAGIDILVSTPHLISSIAAKDPNVLSRVQYLVCDEADSLFDKSFSSTVTSLIDRAAPSLRQLILCSATIPRSLDRFLDHRYPQIKRLVTPKLHSITRRVQLGVVDIDKDPYRGSRQLACADVIWQIGKAEHDDTSHSSPAVKCMMVFVNEREEAEELAKFLASKGIEAVPLTRDTSEQRSSEVLAAFTSPVRVDGAAEASTTTSDTKPFSSFVPFDTAGSSTSGGAAARPSRRLPNTKVLVTTDLGSRGIDTLAVRHVILYDVPHTTIDFVHRLGRVGRMGRRGRGIVLVGRRDRKDIVREVRDAMFQGKALI